MTAGEEAGGGVTGVTGPATGEFLVTGVTGVTGVLGVVLVMGVASVILVTGVGGGTGTQVPLPVGPSKQEPAVRQVTGHWVAHWGP